MVWATGAALSVTLGLTFVLLGVVLAGGLGVFWPHAIYEVHLADGHTILGEEVEHETIPGTDEIRTKYKTGNREDGPAFQWIDDEDIVQTNLPADAFKLDRMKDLNYFGFLEDIRESPVRVPVAEEPGRFDEYHLDVPEEGSLRQRLAAAMQSASDLEEQLVGPIKDEEQAVAKEISDQVKYAVIDAEYRKKLLLRGGASPDSEEVEALDARLAELTVHRDELDAQSHELTLRRSDLERQLRANVAVFRDAAGRDKPIALVDIVRFSCPNQMGVVAKGRFYLSKVWELVSADPREANQDGGLFPAIFGTVLLVFLMAATCFPLGVLAGIYLGEYAREGPLVRLVRVAVNNLAGIPSIVYGIFGLGFFVYLCGGYLDQWFYPARVDRSEPVFGQGCILWASLTLGLLTIPVVIVATEEALRAIPRSVREGSYALGATKFQTLRRVLIPMASPGVMTGFILAMARAAGEVAPLMITGAVKSAPVPVESSFPYVALDRQFMHLGFHIFDISCKSPNVEATKPMVYVTTLLLLFIVIAMTTVAIWLRNRMRKRFQIRTV